MKGGLPRSGLLMSYGVIDELRATKAFYRRQREEPGSWN